MKKCMEHTWTRGRMNDLFERCRWCGETRNLGSEAPSSPVETTAALARPIPPESLNGLTGASYTDVIRREDEGDWCAHVTLARIYLEERDAALEGIIRRDDALGIYDDEVTRLHAQLDAKDATIGRLWAQLNEATNVPDERLQLPNCGDRP